MNHGNGFSPVPLARKNPVPKLVIHSPFTDALLFQPLNRFFLGLGYRQAVNVQALIVGGIKSSPFQRPAGFSRQNVFHLHALFPGQGFVGTVDAVDRQTKFPGEFKIAGIVGGNRHDGAGTVGAEDIIGDPHRNWFLVDGIDGVSPRENARFFRAQFGPFQVTFPGRLLNVDLHFLLLVRSGDFRYQRVLRCQNHVGGAEKSVGSGGKNMNCLIKSRKRKSHLRPFGTADPVDLLGLDLLQKIHLLQIVNQPVGIGSNFQHPLFNIPLFHFPAAAFTAPFHNFFVGQTDFAREAPVNGHFGLIGQTLLKKLNKDPLGPAVIIRVRGGEYTLPIKGKAQGFQLADEAFNILFGNDPGVDTGFNGIILGGQAETVETHGKKDVVPLHPFFPGQNIQSGVGTGMAHVETVPRRIGKFHQAVEFLLFREVHCPEGTMVLPVFLPLGFNRFGFVIHCQLLEMFQLNYGR